MFLSLHGMNALILKMMNTNILKGVKTVIEDPVELF